MTGSYRDKSDEDLQRASAPEREAKQKEVKRQQELFDRAIARRTQGMWWCGGLLLGPAVLLGLLPNLHPTGYVMFGIAWACLGALAFRIERSLQADVESRAKFLDEAREIDTPATAELDRRDAAKRHEEASKKWEMDYAQVVADLRPMWVSFIEKRNKTTGAIALDAAIREFSIEAFRYMDQAYPERSKDYFTLRWQGVFRAIRYSETHTKTQFDEAIGRVHARL